MKIHEHSWKFVLKKQFESIAGVNKFFIFHSSFFTLYFSFFIFHLKK